MIGQSVGSDASRLSCFLFRPRKRLEKRKKRSHTNVSNASLIRTSTLPAQTAHIRFCRRKWVLTRLCSKNRTQRLTRRNRGVSDGGGITTLGAFCAVRKPCVAGYQNGKLCRFWGLVGCAPEERGEPAEQRCAYARRCPEASRPRRAARSGEYAMDYVVSICTLDDNNNRLCRRSRNSCFCACGGGQIQHHN